MTLLKLGDHFVNADHIAAVEPPPATGIGSVTSYDDGADVVLVGGHRLTLKDPAHVRALLRWLRRNSRDLTSPRRRPTDE